MTINNFEWNNPTHLIIKADGSAEIADHIARAGHKSVLLVTGMGSVKKIGVYDKVVDALNKNKIKIFELTGIRANPEIKAVIAGINICRQNKIEAILPLGGGSVYDSCKAIATGALFEEGVKSEQIWECYEGTRGVTKALPIYGVLTISATGTEMNQGGVVQDDETKKKWNFGSFHLYPKVSIIDPKLQTHLPWYQQVNGFVDAITHIMEFLTNIDDTETVETTYAINVSLINSIIKCGNILQKDNANYDARANFVWAATCALNDLSGMAMKGGCWAVHLLEHPMGGINPKISHGAGLGVAFPAFVKANAEKGLRLKTYDRIAREVFGKQGWEGLIEGWVGMLKQWGHPTTLKELFGEVDNSLRAELVRVCKLKPYSGFWPDSCIPEDIIKRSYDLM